MTHLLLEMLLSPWFWLNILLSVAGGVTVYVGLKTERAGEKMLVPPDFRPDIFRDIEEKAKSKIERGWRILMTGIVFEVVAALGISVISGLEIAELSNQTASANFLAKRAETAAGKANERASSNELAVAIVTSNNLVLQHGLQARVISNKQITNFILLTKNLPKIPVRVGVSSQANTEMLSYAWQIRKMFNRAGFPIPSSDTNSFLGIHFIEGAKSVPDIEAMTNMQPFDIELVYNSAKAPNNFEMSKTTQVKNGLPQIELTNPTTNDIYAALFFCLDSDGIPTMWFPTPQWEATNEYEFYVEEKLFIPPEP